jgi:2-hydroxychromene-2-carboxylate isomerase
VRYAYRDMRRYAERQGYMLKGTEKIWDSSIANIAILWVAQNARDRLAPYLDAVYPPFWRRELDIEDVAVIEAALRKADAPTKGFADFASGEGRAAHDTLQDQLHPAGIYGVPSFVFDGQVLFGREHLPFVSWHLDGREGASPDMAYEL